MVKRIDGYDITESPDGQYVSFEDFDRVARALVLMLEAVGRSWKLEGPVRATIHMVDAAQKAHDLVGDLLDDKPAGGG